MKSTLIAIMLVLSMAVAGCTSNKTATDNDTANNTPTSDVGDYSADPDGSVSTKDDNNTANDNKIRLQRMELPLRRRTTAPPVT